MTPGIATPTGPVCFNCRHWEQDDDDAKRGRCRMAEMAYSLAYPQSHAGEPGKLITHAMFGCTMFDRKEQA